MTLTEISDLIKEKIQYTGDDKEDITRIREAILPLAGSSIKQYKEVSGFFTQSGTDIPTLTIVINDFDEVPVFVRYAPGSYSMTLTAAFTTGKTMLQSYTTVRSGGLDKGFSTIVPYLATEDLIGINSYKHVSNGATNIVLNTVADAQVNNMPFSIKVYD